jgi:CheY-like chemotaxis protein
MLLTSFRSSEKSPLNEAPTDHPELANRRRLVLRGTSIFVVDDDASMRVSINRLLREHGCFATLFESATALLGHGDFGNVTCIIIDVDLNDQSGIDLRTRLAQEGVKVPVIYITGNDSPVNRSSAIASGCTAYLTKPFTAQSLIGAIERAQGVARKCVLTRRCLAPAFLPGRPCGPGRIARAEVTLSTSVDWNPQPP